MKQTFTLKTFTFYEFINFVLNSTESGYSFDLSRCKDFKFSVGHLNINFDLYSLN